MDSVIVPSQHETKLILESCHTTLVRLGDLSRYRETELKTNERNWAPAVGYYDLATAITPSSGASHHQLAVIARADGSRLRALYHLYRALSVDLPYPRAQENLDAELKKIIDRKNKNQLFPELPEKQPSVVLQAWFVLLHAKLHDGVHFPEHEELENEVLTSLPVELKERPPNSLLNKIVLSNIAAQHLTSMQAAGNYIRIIMDQYLHTPQYRPRAATELNHSFSLYDSISRRFQPCYRSCCRSWSRSPPTMTIAMTLLCPTIALAD